MTNGHGSSFFLYKNLNKCRMPSVEVLCKRKETPLKMKQIRNTLFLEIIATVVESPCNEISAKERRQMKKKPIQKDFSIKKDSKDDECAWKEFFSVQKTQ